VCSCGDSLTLTRGSPGCPNVLRSACALVGPCNTPQPTAAYCFFISGIPLSPLPSVIMHNPRQRGIRCDY